MHIRLGRQYRPENPELPTLDPWRNTTEPPAEQFVFDRNPYFHRVDENGQQLPYIDQFVLNISSTPAHPCQDRRRGKRPAVALISSSTDYTFLKEAEKREPIKVAAVGAHPGLARGAVART